MSKHACVSGKYQKESSQDHCASIQEAVSHNKEQRVAQILTQDKTIPKAT